MSLLDAFKKKDEGDIPDISDMVKNGMSDQDIIDSLRQQGYDSTAIKAALINASKSQKPAMQQAPQETAAPQSFIDPPPSFQYPSQQPMPSKSDSKRPISDQAMETIQQVLEQIIDEKWKGASSELTALRAAERVNANKIEQINDSIDKLGQRIDRVQNTMLGKTEDYNKTLADVNIELQAFEKVIDRLVPTISDSIKELRDLIDDLKKTGDSKAQ